MKKIAKAGRVLVDHGPTEFIKRVLTKIGLLAKEQEISLSATIAWNPPEGYTLVDGPAGYTYINPRKPDRISLIIGEMEHQPKFSLVVPVYNTPAALLEKLLDSVTIQWYPHWQLILVNDAGTLEETRLCLDRIMDERILVLHLPKNRGIAGATNAGLARADGDFIVFLDHDDELTEDCLFELARCIDTENPDYIYSDEDKITPDGNFTQPHFKPDWSPDTMMSTMYTGHVSCVRRNLLDKLGGVRSEYDGSQDWDLVLRLSEKTNRISHIPKVLYHWRIIPASVAADLAAKPYAVEASKRLRVDALARRDLNGTLEPIEQVPGYFRVNYHLQGAPLISIIIPTRDNASLLGRCLSSIGKHSRYRNYELIIIDNGSTDPATLAYLEQIQATGNATVIRHDAPFNFSELNNLGSRSARGEILLFLNDDTEIITEDWMERMAGYAQLRHVGAVGAKLLYPGAREVQHAGIVNLVDGPRHSFLRQPNDIPGYFMRNLLEYNWLAVTGACLMVERKKFQSVGGFDETFTVAYNDVELCIRLLESGLYNVVCQAVSLIHHESVSRGHDHLDAEKRARLEQEKRNLFNTHVRYYQYDPFHSSNLHPRGANFEITE
jgi:GT2 family glycosyltransferase